MAASSSNDIAPMQVSKMEDAWRKTAAAKKQPRVRVCHDVEEKVKRCIRDHFPGWSLVSTSKIFVVTRLRRDYGGGATLESRLQSDDSIEASKELRAAALEAMSRPARRSRMLQWLSCTSACNKNDMVAICRWVCRLKATVPEQLRGCIEVMRCIARLGLDTTFAAEHTLMRPKWEEVLLQVPSSCAHAQKKKKKGGS